MTSIISNCAKPLWLPSPIILLSLSLFIVDHVLDYDFLLRPIWQLRKAMAHGSCLKNAFTRPWCLHLPKCFIIGLIWGAYKSCSARWDFSLTHVLVCIAQRLELLMVLLQVVVLAYKSSEKGKKNGTYGRICINVPCDGDHFVYISIFTCHETIRS